MRRADIYVSSDSAGLLEPILRFNESKIAGFDQLFNSCTSLVIPLRPRSYSSAIEERCEKTIMDAPCPLPQGH
ncbi:hypothetical protein RRG08_019248 [Elysia crispata]|uniref:Uncharacterized protein n=1 Tax=Elysia crispata TaxID=231223 RepID=A0AAE0YFX2_9GAST|nr:hypothetical protein RRG08_019248 [Elysia crispata]